MDSATADYTIADGIYGTVTAGEHVQPVTVGMAGSEDTYLMIDQQGKLSFHRITVKIQSMSLRPEEAGVYFTGDFAGDALVQQQVDRFGVMVSVEEDPVQTDNAVCRTVFLSEDFNGAATSSLVYGIMRKDLPTEENRERAATAVFARPYVRLADGKELIGDCVSRSLQQQMELACEQWNGFGIRQKQVLWDFYHTYKTEMYSDWNVAKMKSLDKRQTNIDTADYSSYLIPWQKDAVAEAKADGKIHYYFMSGEGLVITKPDTTRWGDACLAVLPNGMMLLIDSGPEVYAPVLLRNLQRLGITKLDAIIISHPHSDHQEGVFSETAILHTGLLDKIPVGKIYWRGGYDSETTDCLMVPDAAAAYGIACEVLERGNVVYFGDIRLEVLWPMAGDGDSIVSNSLEINNFSVVFRLDYGEHSALFTGDLYVKGVSGDVMLLNRTDKRLLDADLMKVPHHGYDTSGSASLLRAVSPEIAVAMGDHTIPDSVFAAYEEINCNLLGDRYYGYVHIAAGTDGNMTTETSRTAAIS
jgi:beta-lactamase superfamily II metal-dependent hydrolase